MKKLDKKQKPKTDDKVKANAKKEIDKLYREIDKNDLANVTGGRRRAQFVE